VKTLQVRGMDATHPAVERMRKRFQKHAVRPEQAARAILRGIARDQYLVFTSSDIMLGHFFQKRFEWPYALVMRFMNDQFQRVAERAPDKLADAIETGTYARREAL
jgi:hypothetical protein